MADQGRSRFALVCDVCAWAAPSVLATACPECNGPLGVRYHEDDLTPDQGAPAMWRWWRRLPVASPDDVVHLGEGATPLLRARTALGPELWLKDETRNPTGSHKDRALAVALSTARAAGIRRSFVVSAGSTGLAHAAYAAAAGIESTVLMSASTDPGRAQLVARYGSRVVRVRAPIDLIIEALERLARERGLHLGSTTRVSNPLQAEGCRTIAFEIAESLGRMPDAVLVPTGGGGTISGLGRGFAEWIEAHGGGPLPRLHAIVPEHWDALARLVEGSAGASPAELADGSPPPTILGKICHAEPPDGEEAAAAVRASGGTVVGIADADALAAVATIAQTEGLFVEPSSAVILPALRRLLAGGQIATGDTVVAMLCGSGFRELPFTPAASVASAAPVAPVERSTEVDLDGLDAALHP